ncbi:SemiSWEET transporter [Candidatus Actinomarina sp.]|jgi:MtN3 and saliva related transmembrane protein|nr:SemiSWEET transporter [Acidimicrobiia bacterium]MDA7572234.1 SemiSWEET transporter [bacterium]MDA7725011.1 SemiSWEET transporter [Acidimicrobiaceae bacterium]MDA8653035.1 SemiSWEET transporter [Candidatus Actinomarina sp.]MDA7548418.1 SemiSWEET transporter [Acidimicrobiia bacterium]|tara:strand:- start:3341 stop:3607 length:267 start_codon:yes stop_codon:yes gene_type:complete
MNLLFFGYFAAFFTAVSFLPQAVKTVRTRETAGLSLLTYLFLFLGSLSWFIYGFYLTDYPLMITNSLTTIFTGIILYLIFSERNSKYN